MRDREKQRQYFTGAAQPSWHSVFTTYCNAAGNLCVCVCVFMSQCVQERNKETKGDGKDGDVKNEANVKLKLVRDRDTEKPERMTKRCVKRVCVCSCGIKHACLCCRVL